MSSETRERDRESENGRIKWAGDLINKVMHMMTSACKKQIIYANTFWNIINMVSNIKQGL